MSAIVKFRVLSDEDPNFIRDYEIPQKLTLKDMHDFVCDDLGYDKRELCSFFLTDGKWRRQYEFTSIDMGFTASDETGDQIIPMTMSNICLEQIIRTPGDRLLYVFDQLGDRALMFEVSDITQPQKGFDYPRLQFANGDAPDQHDADNSQTSRSIFDEAMSDYDDFAGDDCYSDDE
ncbi:MAG: hypothetical protein K2F53_04380 [Rikenellaceae bacterium]|nr:hypothetical protein [Rikenellaceae bacterium]